MNTEGFSLYKLPLLNLLFLIFIYLFMLLGINYYAFGDISALLENREDIALLIGSAIILYIPIIGVLVMLFYHYDITFFTKRNVKFVLVLTLYEVIVLFLLGVLLYLYISKGYTNVFILLAIQPIFPAIILGIVSLILWSGIKVLSSQFDHYKGARLSHNLYWRFSNLFLVFTFFVILIAVFFAIIYGLYLFILDIVQPLTGLLLSFMIIPMLVALFINMFVQSFYFDRLEIKKAFFIALELIFYSLIIAIIGDYLSQDIHQLTTDFSRGVIMGGAIIGQLLMALFVYWVVKRYQKRK